MIVNNLTNKSQYLHVRNLLRGETSTLEIVPGCTREIGSNYIIEKRMTPNFDNIFEVIYESGYVKPAAPTQKEAPKVEETPIVEQPPIVEESNEPEEIVEETVLDKFICEKCGAEFASARGLASHMNRAHPEQ